MEKTKIICARCGSNQVSCAGVLNPNTMIGTDVMDGAYCDAYCDNCEDWSVLHEPDNTIAAFVELCERFQKEYGFVAQYATCRAFYKNVEFEQTQGTHLLRIDGCRHSNHEERPDHSCQGKGEFEKLVRPNTLHFVITDLLNIYGYDKDGAKRINYNTRS